LARALHPASWRILEYALQRMLREGEVALWVDEPWDDVPFEDLEVEDGQQVGCAVFTKPLDFLGGGLDPRDTRLLGYFQPRDGMVWVFLGPVSCSVFTTLPDAVCVFARGLSGEGIACFAAPDATTVVERELKADVVLSGRGDGSVLLAPGCALKVKRGFDSYISSAVPLDQLVGAKMAEQLENEASWEVVSELFD
jgi:hypothetical protein